MNFNLKTPCADCPFRSDAAFYLPADRRAEIADSLLTKDAPFQCHKTINYDAWAEAGHFVPDDRNEMCAGAMIMLHRENKLTGNLAMRLAIMFGLLDPAKLSETAEVVRITEFTES
jgi:hypothetical protein